MSIKDLIKNSVLESFQTDITVLHIVITLAVAAVLGIYIFLIYRMTVKSEFYSKDFNRATCIICVITAAITLTIQSNFVVSLGMVGALSIVRYRTAVKSSLDLMFIFWSISVGIITGAGMHLIAIMLSIMVTILNIVLDKIQQPRKNKLLVIHCSNSDDIFEIIEKIRKNAEYVECQSEMVTADGTELILEFRAKCYIEEYLKDIKEINSFKILAFDRDNRF